VLLSHRTKVRMVDAANLIHANKLAKSGGLVYRYDNDYAHGKIAWNDRGEILFGSANLDKQAMRDNFECDISFTDRNLTEQLRYHFDKDAAKSLLQDETYFQNLPLSSRLFSYACGLAAPWL
jgi:phosphatidylserine/phosphatidylglycerophosphate/cardiolipin synthase-like enzyme